MILTAIDDNIQDPNERIVITLNNTFSDTPPSENITYEIGRKAIIKIIDDENPPVAVTDIYSGTLSVDEGGELIISDSLQGLLVNDYDPEGTKLTIKQFGVPLSGIVSCPTTGLPGICPDGTFSYKHQGDETPSGEDKFSYKITDEDGFLSLIHI